MGFITRWFQNSRWSIRTKLLGGFALICFFLAAITLLSILIIGELGSKIQMVSQAQEEVTQAAVLEDVAADLENALTVINEDLAALELINVRAIKNEITKAEVNNLSLAYVVDYKQQRTNVDRCIERVKKLGGKFVTSRISELDLSGFLRMVNTQSITLATQLDQIQADTVAGQAQKASDSWKTAGPQLGKALTDITRFKVTSSQVVEQVTAASRQAVIEANSTRSNAQLGLGITGGLAVVLAFILGIALTRAFTSPVERLRGRLIKLAEGDLVSRLDVSSRDQFGELAGTFNQSVGRLGGVVEQFQSQAVRVSSAAAQIAAASRQSALISADQAGAVAEATVTIEELSHTAQQIAEAATLVANAAEQALGSASDGQETVRASIKGIKGLKTQVQDIAVKILALSERSQRVGHIIEQITGIADQTHLLALNAAIESAAAGESGKRFAVVAAEVKKLSERSRNATKEVQAVLGEIQAATNASVMATEQGMKEAERGVALAHKSGDANESIIQMVERTVQLASAISLATQQQRSASEQVVASMRQLATVIQDGAASAKQSSSLAMALDEIALELRRLSSQFKVEKSDLLDDNFGADGGPFDITDPSLISTAPLFLGSNSNGAGDGGFHPEPSH